MTFLTDIILAALGFYWVYKILQSDKLIHSNHWKVKWVVVLIFMSIAAMLGGVSHGFSQELSPNVLAKIWLLTLISIGFVSLFLALGLLDIFTIKSIRFLKSLLYIKLGIYLIVLLKNPEFINAIIDYAPIVLISLFSYGYLYFKSKNLSYKCIAIGLMISVLAAVVQLLGIGIHRYFNHNDIYHTIQAVGLYYLYLGVSGAQDNESI